MKLLGVIQTRMESKRLPKKALADICGHPMVWHIWNRLAACTQLDAIVACIPDTSANDELEDACGSFVGVFRGPEVDLIARIYRCGAALGADAVVRITGDNPLVDPRLVDKAISRFRQGDVDYVSNLRPRTYPRGLDVEVYGMDVLAGMYLAIPPEDVHREWFPIWFWEHEAEYKTANIFNVPNQSKQNWTVDYPEDLEFVRKIYPELKDTKFSAAEVSKVIARLKLVNGGSAEREGDWPWSNR